MDTEKRAERYFLKRYFVIDASGFDPFRGAIEDGRLKSEQMEQCQSITNTDFVITCTAWNADELIYTTTPSFDNLKIQQSNHSTATWQDNLKLNAKKVYLLNNGSITNGGLAVLESRIWVAGDNSLLTFKTLWSGTQYWSALSDLDRLAIIVANHMIKRKENVVVIANDYQLRKQLDFEHIPFMGAGALLAEMVLEKVLSIQKATKLYAWWSVTCLKWVPKNYSFSKLLNFGRVKKQKERLNL